MERVIIKIFGRVQGVFFRWEAKKEADELGIYGFAKNEKDGSVLIVAEGEKEKLEKLAEWCRAGTPYSKVEKVETERQKPTGEFNSFNVIM